MASMLETVLGGLISGGGADAVAKKTGMDSSQVGSVLSAALPALMQSMHNNSKDEKGAKALDESLAHHAAKGKKTADALVEEADEKEGAKIVKNVLGDKTDSITSGIAKATGMDAGQVSSILATAAPAVMNLLGHQKQDGGHDANGLSDMLGGLLGGAGGKGGFDLGGIMNMAMADKDGDGQSDLLGNLAGLFGGKK